MVKSKLLSLLSWCLLAAGANCLGQDSTKHQAVFPSGIGLQIGTGHLALVDEHISNEKYAGSSSWFALHWSRYHETYEFRIGMLYQKASSVRNYNISAEVTRAGFNLVNMYPAGTIDLFGRRAFVTLGPNADMLFYFRRQNIAQNTDAEPNVYQSAAWLFSLGGGVDAILPVSVTLQIEGALQLGLVSLGGGTGSSLENSTGMRMVTLFTGMHGSAVIGVRCYPIESVSLRAGYTLDVTRINSWNYLLMSSDNAIILLGYHF